MSIDNNDVEREIRNVVIGRKNYLFFGGERGGENAAVFYTIIAACRAEGVNPEEYLADVLDRTRMADPREIEALTPQEWKRRRQLPAAITATV